MKFKCTNCGSIYYRDKDQPKPSCFNGCGAGADAIEEVKDY